MSIEGHSCGPEPCWECGEEHTCICGNCGSTEADFSPTTDESWALVDLLKNAIENVRDEPQFTVAEHALMAVGEIHREWLAEHDAKVRAEGREKADREPSDAEVEAAARAMAHADVTNPDGWVMSEEARNVYRDMARAALIAAQEVRDES